jgi:hypothetical protein
MSIISEILCEEIRMKYYKNCGRTHNNTASRVQFSDNSIRTVKTLTLTKIKKANYNEQIHGYKSTLSSESTRRGFK